MAMGLVKTSVIIPVYNGEALIDRCLRSVFAQVGPLDLEVIVIDDGSTDDSLARVKAYGPTLVLLQQDNQGPAAARNRGIASATGKYISFLDADDHWNPYFLYETIGFMERHPLLVACSAGQCHKFPGKRDMVMPRVLEESPGQFKSAQVLDDLYGFWYKHNHLCTGSVLMRSDVVKKTKGQRPELRITEDLEFWAYLGTYGSWGFIPRVLFTSDGAAATKEQGWVSKNKRRWDSAPTIEQWSQRILGRLPQEHRASFNKLKGQIARRLTYSMILSNRIELARMTTKVHGTNYPSDLLSRLFRVASPLSVSWRLLAQLINLRETNRKL